MAAECALADGGHVSHRRLAPEQDWRSGGRRGSHSRRKEERQGGKATQGGEVYGEKVRGQRLGGDLGWHGEPNGYQGG
jgi:hypothetical protein